MLAYVGLALVAIVLLVLIIAAMKPSHFRVERRATVSAAPEAVYPHIADFRRWRAWSPWEGIDPELKRTYGGAETGRGAVYSWDGNKQAGAGRMEITDAAAPSRVEIDLSFTRPFAARNTTEFTLVPTGTGTEVAWAMHGPQPFMFKLMSVFTDMDRMLGKDFEKGLASLRSAVEGRPA